MQSIEDSVSPATTPPAAAPTVVRIVKPKRGLRFWLIFAGATMLGIPLIAGIGTWAFINLGLLNSTIAQRIAKRLGTSAHVGAVHTDAFRHFRIDDLRIDPAGPSSGTNAAQTISVEAIKLDFSVFEALKGHVQTLTIDRPTISVLYDPPTGWKPSLKPSSETGTAMRIDRVDFNEGTLAMAWEGAGSLLLSHVNAVIVNPKVRSVDEFSMHASLNSGQPLTIEGTMAQGAVHAHLYGGAVLDRDYSVAPKFDPCLKGLLQLDLRAVVSNAMGGAKTSATSSGTFALKNFEAAMPDQKGTLRGEIGEANLATEWSGDAERATFYLRDLDLKSVAVTQSPLSKALQDFHFSGHLSGQVDFEKNVPKTASIDVDLVENKSAAASMSKFTTALFGAPLPKAVVKCSAHLERSDDGAWSVQDINAAECAVPFSTVGSMLGLFEKLGLTLDGDMKIQGFQYESKTGAASGKIRIEGGVARCALPADFQDNIENLLVAVHCQDWASELKAMSAIGKLRVAGVKDIRAECDVHASRETLSATGRVDPFTAFVQLPVYGDYPFSQTSVVRFEVLSSPAPDGPIRVHIKAQWQGGSLHVDARMRALGQWCFVGALTDKDIPCSAINFNGEIDFKQGTIGPLVFSTAKVKFPVDSKTPPTNSSTSPHAAAGEIRGARILIEPFSMDAAKPFALSGSLTFDGAAWGPFSAPHQSLEIDATLGRVASRRALYFYAPGCIGMIDPVSVNIGMAGTSPRVSITSRVTMQMPGLTLTFPLR